MEKEVREAWRSFCQKAKAAEAKGYVVRPGASLNDPCRISETAAARPPAQKTAEVSEKQPKSRPSIFSKPESKDDTA